MGLVFKMCSNQHVILCLLGIGFIGSVPVATKSIESTTLQEMMTLQKSLMKQQEMEAKSSQQEKVEAGEDYALSVEEAEVSDKPSLDPYKVDGNNVYYKVPSNKDKSVIQLDIKDIA